MRLRFGFGLVCLALIAADLPAAAFAAFPGTNGRIAYVTPGDSTIHSMNADGSDQTNLSQGGNPVWSPDGHTIAFAHNGLNVMNADGSGQTPLNVAGADPAWSPDAAKIAFVTHVDGNDEIYVVNADGSGTATNLTQNAAGDGDPTWSPDGSKIAFVSDRDDGGIYVMNADDGSGQTVLVQNSPGGPDGAQYDSQPDWSPDGSRIAFIEYTSATATNDIWVVNSGGGGKQSLTPLDDDFGWDYGHPAWSPDGSKLAFDAFAPPLGHDIYTMDVDDSDPSHATDLTNTQSVREDSPEWQPGPDPVIFVHGFLGSKIFCDGSEDWPNLPFPALLSAPGHDGHSTPGCASAGPHEGELVETALGQDIYKSTVDFLRDEFPTTFHLYAWDWRKSPEEAIAGLDALIEEVRPPPSPAEPDGGQVVLMAHSMGGLVTRLYVNDPARAAKVKRVLTVGTPYWGSPKAMFPFVYGVESPGLSGLDAFIQNDALRNFSRYLQGLFFLWPSAPYGGWLSIEDRSPDPLNTAGLLSLIDARGGNPSLLSTALAAHAQRIDEFDSGGTDYQTLVGTGIHTIGAVRIERAPEFLTKLAGAFDIDIDTDIVHVSWTNGDGTVPLRSAVGSTPQVRRHFSCGIPHVPLPGDPSVAARVKDFLADGAPIGDGLGPSSVLCEPTGFALSIFPLGGGVFASSSVGVRASAGGLSLEEAEARGLVESLNTGHQIEAATSTTKPLSLTLKTKHGAALELSPMTNGVRGKAHTYIGQGGGALTIELSDKAVVKRGAKKIKSHAADNRAPRTRVRARIRGGRATLSFKVSDSSPTITYVKSSGRTRRVHGTRLRLSARALRRGILVLSIDAFGNAEEPRRFKRG